MLENGTIISGSTVLYSVMVKGRRLLMAANDREYVTGWLVPKVEGCRQEWAHGNYRRLPSDLVINFMTRYRDAGGLNHETVLNELREALSAWQKGETRG